MKLLSTIRCLQFCSYKYNDAAMRHLQFCSYTYNYRNKGNEHDKECSLLKHDRFLFIICLFMFFTETDFGSSKHFFNSSCSSFTILRKQKILNMPLPQVCQ